MAKSFNQKARILYLMKLLWEDTDEEHPFSRKQLEERLGEYGIYVERKTLYNDLETLRNFGMGIEYRKERPEGYYLANRDFELAELKLLVDAVLSSRFITEKKSASLICKIEALTSTHEAKQLQRQVVVTNRIKAMNESIYYNVDKLHTAIGTNRQIAFHYFEWTSDKQKRLRRNGQLYQVSPWALTWDDENYYLIGYDEAARFLKHFRVDKMQNIAILEDNRVGQEEFGRFDLANYTKKTFGMFGGEEETVRLRFPDRFVGVVIDRFGIEVPMHPDGEGYFTARIDVAVSEQFFGWVTGLGREVKILSPKSVARAYRELLEEIGREYLTTRGTEDK